MAANLKASDKVLSIYRQFFASVYHLSRTIKNPELEHGGRIADEIEKFNSCPPAPYKLMAYGIIVRIYP
jgi:hypothetical protein